MRRCLPRLDPARAPLAGTMERRGSRSARPAKAVEVDLLAGLGDCRAYPSVSVLLATTPGPVLASEDVVRLHGLIDGAQRCLSGGAAAHRGDGVIERLRALAVAVRRSPSDRGLALFASQSQAEAVHLGVAVDDRVVVGSTFATWDLVRSSQANPRFRLLVLSERRARLFEGWSAALSEVTTDAFPVWAGPVSERGDRSRRFGKERSDRRDAALRTQMRAIDVALAARAARKPLPLVTAGVARQLGLFREMSSEAGSVVGEIRGSHERTPIARLGRLARPIIERHCRSVGLEALSRLDGVRDRTRLVVGIDQVRAAAVEGRIAMLCVEEGITQPALVVSGRPLVPEADVELPKMLEELIGLVNRSGGETVLVEDGALASRRGVAGLLWK